MTTPDTRERLIPTKEDLLAAILERRKALLLPEVLAPSWERVSAPIERVFGLLAGYRQMLTMTEFDHGCPIDSGAEPSAQSSND